MVFHTGQLLVATPRLLDPNFRRGVLFVLDHDSDGALAVVLNRPSELPLEVVLPGWGQAVVEPPCSSPEAPSRRTLRWRWDWR